MSQSLPAGVCVRALDKADHRIIRALLRDARMSMRALAERVHISRANAYARVERLLEEGVIVGFAAKVVPERVGLGTSAYISVQIEQDAWKEVSEAVVNMQYVEHVSLLGADVDVMALVRTPDNATLRDVVLERFHRVPGVKSTRTWLIFEEREGRSWTPVEDAAP